LYSLGAKPSETCVPFLVGNSVRRGDHLAWGGRSAATFANSVLGALTNLEEPDVVLASAMVGLVPEHGLHLDEARRPTVAVRIPKDMHIEAGRLGQILSGVVRNEVPVICGTHFDMAQARRFVFNLNAEGNVPLAYLRDDPPENVDVMDLDPGACRYEEAGFQPDLVVLGCPHLSEQEINEWARRLADARSLDMEIWTYTAQLCHDKCPKTIRPLQLRGKVRTGTCPLADMEDMKGRKVVCDSPVLAECLAQHRLDVRYLPSEHLAHMIKGYDQSLPQDTCHSNVHISPRP
ncbi:MAG TPA: aconitase X, partial [Methanomassiliicoccales archaeon]|nr:aconitase X [Methanomassiliicoccales archaeon]